jgi:hypothetical protein
MRTVIVAAQDIPAYTVITSDSWRPPRYLWEPPTKTRDAPKKRPMPSWGLTTARCGTF